MVGWRIAASEIYIDWRERMVGAVPTAEILYHGDGNHPAKKRCRRERKWTRFGCLTCKRRRKRCDEAKPRCHSCIRLGLTCEGYGSMWAAPLGPDSWVIKQSDTPRDHRSNLSPTPSISSTDSSAAQISPCSTLVLGVENSQTPPSIHSDEQEDLTSGQDRETSDRITVASPDPSRLISHLSELDKYYLQYHMEKGSKLLANLETDDNPLRSLLIPRALSSPVLMNALCALSAIHFSNRSHHSWCAENEAARYYIKTIRGLRTTLTNSQVQLLPDNAILAVALLCKYEITRGSVKQWPVHLDALETLIISRGGFIHLDEETWNFVRGLFIYANNLAKITNRRVTRNSIPGLDNSSPAKLDIYIGYTEEILKICARIADLPLLSSDPLALALEVNTINTLLHTWISTKTTYIVPKGTTEATLSRLHMVADSFRDATYIYLHSTLDRIIQISAPPTTRTPITSIPLLSKSTAISNLLHRIRARPIDNNCEYSALTFPLFIAGCEAASAADRCLIIQTLGTLEANFGIGNVKRAKELLGILWRNSNRGKHWADVLLQLGWDLILV
ncbi:fungal-specific transcription factor domain-containing protein [Aspergillus egyptiacus]|nr:fungal-specific transcription factor domain-containing protein [Aspergillus egyptiacus]